MHRIHRGTSKTWNFWGRWAVVALVLAILLAGQNSSSVVIDRPQRVVVIRIPDRKLVVRENVAAIATFAVAVVAGGDTVAARAI